MDFKACEICSSRGTPGWVTKDDQLAKCDCLVKHDLSVLIAQRISQTGVKSSYLHYDIGTYISKSTSSKKNLVTIKRIIILIEDFIRNRGHLYIYGLHNTQKTSVVSHLAREVAIKNISVYYTTMAKIVDTLMRSSDYTHSEESQVATSLKCQMEEVDLLIVDDAFDPGKLYFSGKSNYKVTLLDSFFTYRRDSSGANVFVSNINKHKIDLETFGTSLIEMIQANCLDLHFEDKLNESEMQSSLLKKLSEQEA